MTPSEIVRAPLSQREVALARALFYRLGSHVFRSPGDGWEEEWSEILDAAPLACVALEPEAPALAAALSAAIGKLDRERLDPYAGPQAYLGLFGPTPRAGATPYETEWLTQAGELAQYHALADIAAFYRAFGLDLAPGCGERADHLSIELAYLQGLCLREAHGLERGLDELVEAARTACAAFLKDHLARWAPGICRRIERCDARGPYGAAARLLQLFLDGECARFGVTPGDPTADPPESSLTLEDCCVGCELARTCADSLQRGGAS
jgi:TorA maturation chaperone TorD